MDFSTVKNYSTLLKTIVQNKQKYSSGNIVVKILEICQNSNNREQTSEQITKIINESNTKQEIIEKLNTLYDKT